MSQEEHAYKVFHKMLESRVFPSVMLLFGPEEHLCRWAVEELVSALIQPAAAAMDCAVFSEGDPSVPELIAACETLPFLSERRLVILEDCDLFQGGRSRRYSSSDQEELLAYVKTVPETAVLVFKCAGVDKRTAMYKAVCRHGMAFEFTAISGQALRSFIRKRLSGMGKTASAEAIGSLVQRTGYGEKNSDYTLQHMINDLIKAAAYSRDTEVSALDFEAVTSAGAQSDAFQLLEAAFSGEKGLALRQFRNRLSGLLSSEVDGEIFQLIALLCAQLEMMLEARERLSEGQKPSELPALMGVHQYRLRKALEAAGGRSIAELSRALDQAYRMEKDIKSGSMPPELAMELFLAMV